MSVVVTKSPLEVCYWKLGKALPKMTPVNCVPGGTEKAGSCSEFCASGRVSSYKVRGPDNRLSASLGDGQGPFQGAVVALGLFLPNCFTWMCPRASNRAAAFSSPVRWWQFPPLSGLYGGRSIPTFSTDTRKMHEKYSMRNVQNICLHIGTKMMTESWLPKSGFFLSSYIANFCS